MPAPPPCRSRRRGVLGGARRTAPAALASLLLLLFLTAAVAAWTATPAAEALHHAGLVVRYGDGHLTYAAVPFPEESISGIELLRRGLAAADVPLLTIGFGGLGEGVCQIAGTGCQAGECRRRVCQGSNPNDPYWRYFRQAAPGDWQPLPLGASGSVVRDGDVDAWSWSGTAAGLPALSLADVARLAGADPSASAAAGRTVLPPGASPSPEAGSGWTTYAGAGAILAAIGGGALFAARRRATVPAA
jgi:hypothetical protein